MSADGILILGSSGFVGRTLLPRLEESKKEVYCISTQQPPTDYGENVRVFTSTLDDISLLRNLLPKCKTVVYLASHSNPGFSAFKPFLEVKYNLLPGLRFLEILQEYPQIQLLYLSSGGAIYGRLKKENVSEKTPLTPVSYYGAGKASMEKFILAYCMQSGGRATILRPTNFYGPGQPFKEGFGIIPTIFQHIVSREKFTIWGDGETVRDYLFIDDFIELLMLLIEQNDGKAGVGKIFNVGAGVGTSINALCQLIEEVTGETVLREYKKARIVDVPRSVLDCTGILEEYQWRSWTKLRKGLEATWSWYLKNREEPHG